MLRWGFELGKGPKLALEHILQRTREKRQRKSVPKSLSTGLQNYKFQKK